jgi:hypothetical protein
MKKTVCFFLVLALAPSLCLSEDSLEQRAKAAWDRRDELDQALLAVELYEQLAQKDPGDIESRIMIARATHWAIEADEILAELTGRDKMSRNAQAELMELGIKACREVIEKDPENIEANYWIIWDMAARTMAKGIFSGFAFKEAIMGTILVSRKDVTYQYGGIYRYWARVIHEIPGILGRFFHFTEEDSVILYKKCIEIEPGHFDTRFRLAQSYEDLDMDEKAREQYEFCASQPADILPEAAAENRLFKRWAQKRLQEM